MNLTQSVSFIVVPYICGISEKIKRLLNKLNIKVALKPLYAITNFVPFPKDSVKKEELSGLIYQVPCADCNLIYSILVERNEV